MLIHTSIGPTSAGRYLVTYITPGCTVPTIACDCSTAGQAAAEATRLNRQQYGHEKVLQCERGARGLRGTYHGLGAN